MKDGSLSPMAILLAAVKMFHSMAAISPWMSDFAECLTIGALFSVLRCLFAQQCPLEGQYIGLWEESAFQSSKHIHTWSGRVVIPHKKHDIPPMARLTLCSSP